MAATQATGTPRCRLGAVAQLGERLVRNEEVRGSIPLGSTIPPLDSLGEPWFPPSSFPPSSPDRRPGLDQGTPRRVIRSLHTLCWFLGGAGARVSPRRTARRAHE